MKKKQKKAAKAAKKVEKKIKAKKQKIVDKIQNKEEKKNKKILKLVRTHFPLHDENVTEAVAKSVVVNKSLLKKDADRLKKWQEEYYNVLFGKIKTLIIEHNNNMEFDADGLSDEIKNKKLTIRRLKQELGKIKEEIKSLKIEKGILVDA